MLIHRMIHRSARGLDKISNQRGLKSSSMPEEEKSEADEKQHLKGRTASLIIVDNKFYHLL